MVREALDPRTRTSQQNTFIPRCSWLPPTTPSGPPRGPEIRRRMARDSLDSRAIDVHDIDLIVPVAITTENDLSTVR